MASQQIYQCPQTPIVFRGSGGDAQITLASLSSVHGRISNVWDRGAGSAPARYKWRANLAWASAPIDMGDVILLFLITASAPSTPAFTDGGLTFGDAGFSGTLLLPNLCLQQFGEVSPSATGSTLAYSEEGMVWIYERYAGLMVYNNSLVTSRSLDSTESHQIITFTPMPEDVQASA